MRRYFTRTIFPIIAFLVGCSSTPPAWEIDYQKAQDPIRIQHAHSIACLVEEFYGKVGYYPLSKGKYPLPAYVVMKQGKKYPPPAIPVKELELEMSQVLGRKIQLPYDPQRVDAWGYRLYQYQTNGKDYFVSVHLFFDLPQQVRYVAPYTYKYQVSSKAVPKRKILCLADVCDCNSIREVRK